MRRAGQRTLAAHAQIDRSIIARLEWGSQQDLKVSILVALARALEVTTDSLIVASARADDLHPQLVTELAAVVEAIAQLSLAHQHRVAAILWGYVSGLPE